MAKPVKAVTAKKDVADTEAPKSGKKKLIIILLVVLLAGAVSAWILLKNKFSGPSAEEHKVVMAKDPIFIALDVFTVNLQHEDADQYLQIAFSFKVFNPELTEKITAVLPEIRSKLNLLLSSKYPSELSTVAGKKQLATEIAVAANNVLGIHNSPKKHPGAAASSPADAADAHADGEVATNVIDNGNTDPEVTDEKPAAPPAPKQRKGVVDVMFTSFIIQ